MVHLTVPKLPTLACVARGAFASLAPQVDLVARSLGSTCFYSAFATADEQSAPGTFPGRDKQNLKRLLLPHLLPCSRLLAFQPRACLGRPASVAGHIHGIETADYPSRPNVLFLDLGREHDAPRNNQGRNQVLPPYRPFGGVKDGRERKARSFTR